MKKPFFYGLWTLASLLFFLWFLFPGAFVETLVEARAHGLVPHGSVDVNGVGPALPLGLKAKTVSYLSPDFSPVAARDVRVTPAWLTVVTASPGLRVKASCFGGTVKTSMRVAYKGGWRSLKVKADAIRLAALLPYLESHLPVKMTLSGLGDASLNLTREPLTEGGGKVALSDVVVGFDDPLVPVDALTFSTVTAEVTVKGQTLTLSRLHVEGTELDAELRGTVTLTGQMASSRINLTGTVDPDPAFVKALSDRVPLAMLVDPKLLKRGRIPLRITGSLADPRVSLK